MKVAGLEIATGDPMAAQMNLSEPAGDDDSFPAGGCAAGVSGLTILADGKVTPCRRLPLPLGRVGRDSLRRFGQRHRYWKRFRDRSRYEGACARCRRWAGCRGCRAMAYAYAAVQGEPDYLAEDPQCFMSQE